MIGSWAQSNGFSAVSMRGEQPPALGQRTNGSQPDDVLGLARKIPIDPPATHGFRRHTPGTAPDMPCRSKLRLPAPRHHIIRHAIQPVPVRGKTSNRSSERHTENIVGWMKSPGRTHIISSFAVL
jgi:hypothetical protein